MSGPSGFDPVVAVTAACTACGLCLATCPTGALRPARHRPAVEAAACTGCLACVEICPRDALVEAA